MRHFSFLSLWQLFICLFKYSPFLKLILHSWHETFIVEGKIGIEGLLAVEVVGWTVSVVTIVLTAFEWDALGSTTRCTVDCLTVETIGWAADFTVGGTVEFVRI